MQNFKDKVVWITGASSGIGEALALQLAERGARLILSARRIEELQRVARRCGLPDLDLLVLPFDLADTRNASGLAAQVMNKFGKIDILINNGGVSQRSEVLQTSEETERLLMEVNYFAQINLTKAVLPYMLRQKEGRIIVVSSIAGKLGFFLRSSYCAAKHALHGYFESLRLELESRGISVLLVCPGKIRTNVSLNAFAAGGKKHAEMDPSHIAATTAEECAKQIIKNIFSAKEEIYIGGKEIIVVYLKRWFPAIFRKVIRKQPAT